MISSPDGAMLISSLGWVDHDFLWCFDVRSARVEHIPLGSRARYLSLHSSGGTHFSVGHHFDGSRFELTLHHFAEPARVLSRAMVQKDKQEIDGDPAWAQVPRLYLDYFGFAPWNDYVLLKILPSAGRLELQPLLWFDDGYDKGYQGVLEVLELPGEESALVSVQRSSQLILHDLQTGMKKGSIDLGSRGGNPKLAFANAGNEIWASDYDTIVVLESNTWRILHRARLQIADPGVQLFIGDFAFAPDRDICVVARPFQGDVAGINRATLKVECSAKLGRQPLAVAALARGRIVARDWKSGDLLLGELG